MTVIVTRRPRLLAAGPQSENKLEDMEAAKDGESCTNYHDNQYSPVTRL